MISPASRYAAVGQAVLETEDGRAVPYLRRRIIAPPDDASTLTTVVVTAGSRLDLVAARLQGDPLQAWRIADANCALDPADLVATPGRVLRVPKPGF